MIAVTGLGLAAALLFALSAFLQQRAAHDALRGDTSSLKGPRGVLRFARTLVRSKTWVVGWVTNVCGNAVQAVALKVGSVTAVQPLLSTQLLFALTLASAEERRWPRPRDWASALAVCAGLVLLLTAEGATPLTGAPHRGRAVIAMACAIALIAVLLLIARLIAGRPASILIGVGAGLCHAMNAVFMKLTVEDLSASAAVDWPLYALVASTLGGFVLGQLAFASGPLPSAVAAMSVTNPVAGFVAGVLAFDAPMPRDPGVVATIAVAGVMIAAGIVGLANASPTQDLYRGVVADASGRPRSGSRCGSSRCPATAVNERPGDTGGSTPAHTDASRPSASD